MQTVKIVFVPEAQEWIDAQAREMLGDLADTVLAHAQGNAPKVTGELVRSMAIEFIAPLTFRIGAYAPYAHFVELGTRYMRPQPFLRPALYGAQVRAMVAGKFGGL